MFELRELVYGAAAAEEGGHHVHALVHALVAHALGAEHAAVRGEKEL